MKAEAWQVILKDYLVAVKALSRFQLQYNFFDAANVFEHIERSYLFKSMEVYSQCSSFRTWVHVIYLIAVVLL